MRPVRRLFLPSGTDAAALPLLIGRALRAFCDGYVAVLLPAYLLALGLGTWEVGVLATATLAGSAAATIAIGLWGHRVRQVTLLATAALLMVATGFGFAASSSFWPLLLVAFVGTLNLSGGDVSVFQPLEHARLAEATASPGRTALFARYSLLGAFFAAFGALAAALPEWFATATGVSPLLALRAMFVVYGLVGLLVFLLYRRLPPLTPRLDAVPVAPTPLGPSRRRVVRLALLFSVDAFAGGLVAQTLLALWLFQRFEVSIATAGAFFFWAGLCTAASQLAAPWLARRVGLLNTMVWTHVPASLCLIAAAFSPTLPLALGLLILRALLSQMDVPARSAFVMAVVTPGERAAAASFTAVPRSLASAVGPTLGGAFIAAGWMAAPLLVCGVLKIAYDIALWRDFRKVSADG